MKLKALLISSSMLDISMLAQPAFAAEDPPVASQPADTPVESATDDSGIGEIVVTAERRDANMQKTGLSVSVRRGEDLAQQGRTTLAQILEDVPSVSTFLGTSPSQIASSDMAGTFVAIRGVVSNQIPGASILLPPPSAAVYVDGVYEGIGGDYDINRVEVLRGPQGTLYGRSATSGAINFRTKDPKMDDFSVDAIGEVGSYGLLNASGGVNVPLGDGLAMRVSGRAYSTDPYYPTDGHTSGKAGRIKLLVEPTDGVSLILGGALEFNKTESVGVAPYMVSPNKVVYTDLPVPDRTLPGKNSYRQLWAELNADLGIGKLTYLGSYRDWHLRAAVFALGSPSQWTRQPLSVPSDEFITHELRLSSQPGSKLAWQFGASYYENDIELSKQSYWTTSGTLNYSIKGTRKTTDAGIFGEITVPLTGSLRVTGGVRYDKTVVNTNLNYARNTAGAAAATAPYNPNPTLQVANPVAEGLNKSVFHNFTYKGRLEYDLSPVNMVYAMISTAFLPGDVQVVNSGANLVVIPYEDETVTSYEIGSKNRFLDDTLQVNAAAFYYDYTGYQASLLTNPANPSYVVANLPVRMIGGELEIDYRLTRDDRFMFNFSVNDAKFTDTSSAGSTISEHQDRVWNIIPVTIQSSYSHTFHFGESTVAARVAGRWLAAHDLTNVSDGTYADGGRHYQRAGSAFIGDVDLTWTSPDEHFSVTGYVRNVTDKRYKTSVLLTSTSGPNSAGYYSTPRTIGAVLSAHF